MLLFANEAISIKQIYTVIKYQSDPSNASERFTRYPGKLFSYELIFRLSSHSVTTFHGHTFDCTPDSVLLLPKELDNEDYTVNRTEYGSCIDFYFDSDSDFPREAVLFHCSNPEIRASFVKAQYLWADKRTGYYAETMSLLYNIIALIQKEQHSYMPRKNLLVLESAEKYMEENALKNHFDYVKLAALSGLSYSYFKKLFIAKHGMPPMKYITMLKIKHAQELLITQKYSVTEVAVLCGFENVYYFSNLFKKITGIPPSKYKG